MPNFEQSNFSKKTHQSRHAFGYDKIYATLNQNADDHSVLARLNRFSVTIKDDDAFYNNLNLSGTDEYENTAGSDLSALFVPFQSTVDADLGTMPGFASSTSTSWSLPSGAPPKLVDLLPFRWEPGDTTNVYDIISSASGDAIRDLVTGEKVYGDPSQYRDLDYVRGIAFRLPMMAAGWGYTLDTNVPYPSGEHKAGTPTNAKFFKGNVDNPSLERGWQMDPADYIVAPVDFRYDTARNVWTCGGNTDPSGTSFWAKITDYEEIYTSGNRWRYSWTEQKRRPMDWTDKPGGRSGVKGSGTGNFALNSIEANNTAGTGIKGNSIDHTKPPYPSGFNMLPVRGSPVVKMWQETDENDGTLYYSFEYINSEDGDC